MKDQICIEIDCAIGMLESLEAASAQYSKWYTSVKAHVPLEYLVTITEQEKERKRETERKVDKEKERENDTRRKRNRE